MRREERRWSRLALVAAMFLLSYVSLPLVRFIPGYVDFFRSGPEIGWWMENALRPLVPVALGLLVLYGPDLRRWAGELGLDRPAFPALVLAGVLTLPLTVGPLLFGVPPAAGVFSLERLFGAGIWPLAEEVNFRGFAFGQIYAFSGLGFWPAGLLTSGLFGVAHMANAMAAGLGLGGQLLNALVVGVSALGLAWLYFSWDRNLWLVFFLHGLANLGASLYMSGDVAAEDGLFVVLLGVTLAAGVGVTVLRGRFSGTRHLSLQPRGALGLDAIRGGVSSSSHSWPFV